MSGHRRLLTRTLVLLAALILLITGHGVILYYTYSHLALSTALMSGVVVLVLIKHRGLLAPLFAWLGRKRLAGRESAGKKE